MTKQILFGLVTLIIAFVVFYAYYGGFKKIKFRIIEAGGETLVYEEITGDYKQSGVVMDKIYHSLLNEDKIETYKGFGVYYDNPQKVEKSKLRSEAGCVLKQNDLVKITELKEKYSIRIFPQKKYITTEFPFKGKISVIFSIMKVYPVLNKFAKENGYNENSFVMEIYDVPNKKILYRKEIMK
ncbi:MAG: GyrI-like domain-containing protein [Candidatus Cloacimonetes bacterium]|nr:GyrI-like domain-containing protein [Candidatus Cloacimonadota bacterium]